MAEFEERTYFFECEDHMHLLSNDARCTATTRRGERCRNPVFYGQEWGYDQDVHEDRLIFDSQEALERAVALLCPMHYAMATSSQVRDEDRADA